ncbi:DUF6233 domain-containing protein [Streptomyces sp. Tu102]|uniref:DUF6233 domain-containing protein n=1 Tax=Streptomyces TaxID=1883 RepID=UPI00202A887B|nr:DUF6233 domain-containing protein [Streptomyces sp. Tu102]
MAGKRRRTVSRDEARRLLGAGLESCTHCQPDTSSTSSTYPPAQPAGPFGATRRAPRGSPA